MLNSRDFIGCNAPYNEADFVLFGAPFDSTASFRPGSRFAAQEMRTQSVGMETYSPYQDKDMEDLKVFDAGDLQLSIGNTEMALDQVESFTAQILQDRMRPAMVGGEHLVTLGAVRAVYKHYPDLHVIHFDAHADMRDDYLGAALSHATVMRRVWDLLGDGRIYQFGVRSGDRSEFLWGRGRIHTQKFNLAGLEGIAEKLGAKPVYFTFDLDVLDPSVFPGTGNPEAGGACFGEVMDAIKLLSPLNIVGFDIVELSPPYDQSGISTAAACKLLRECLLYFSAPFTK